MRTIGLALLLIMIGTSTAQAQFFKPKVKIDNIRVGFRPVGGGSSEFGPGDVVKAGVWAPVSFSLEYLDDKTRAAMKVEITATDGDGFRTVCTMPIVDGLPEGLDPPAKGSKIERTELTHTVYARISGETSSLNLRIKSDDADDRSISDVVEYQARARPVSTFVILSLGTSLPGFTFKPKTDEQKAELHEPRVQLARLDTTEEMPDSWFGYQGADIVVLPTGKADGEFLQTLFNGTKAERKRRALFEWVRRGGKLIVSMGAQADVVRASTDFAKIFPVVIGTVNRVPQLLVNSTDSSSTSLELKYKERPAPRNAQQAIASSLAAVVLPDLLPVVDFKPTPQKSPYMTLQSDGGKRDRPVVVQAALGLGCVVLVGFDLDRSPFIDHPNRGQFWEALLKDMGSKLASDVPTAKNGKDVNAMSNASLTNVGPEDGAAAAIRKNIDSFEGVPVISFGWVALFILIYTIIIGPLEYIILKKVFGKLELTWITFPLIVLSVSAAAYITAYAVKGKDLRINKIDVVDLDLRSAQPRTYGQTWFTIFSPRIDSYTIGVEPKEGWGRSTDETGYSPVPTVDWFGQVVQSTGLSRGGSGSGRTYTYEMNPLGDDRRGSDDSPARKNLAYSNGLSNVPIQVWSTKAFSANWSGLLDGLNPPVVADLRQIVSNAGGKRESDIDGKITLNLPVRDVHEAFAIYRGRIYPFETGFAPGLPIRFATATTKTADEPFKLEERFYENDQAESDEMFGGRRNGGRISRAEPAKSASGAALPLPLFGLLFHEKSPSKLRGLQNSTLRMLDHSWRLDERNEHELILVLKLRRANGQPEELMTAAEGASPSKLWLHGLPGRDQRTAIDGLMQQDTYIRIYLPVKPPGTR